MNTSRLERLIAVVTVYQHNFRILHWRCVGAHFDTIHELMQKYYEKLGEYLDELTEILMMNSDGTPISLPKALSILEHGDRPYIVLDGSEEYPDKKCFEVVKILFRHLLDDYVKVKGEVGEDVSSKLDEHSYWIRKELQYKLYQREGFR